MGTSDSWNYLATLGVHHRAWSDPIFVEGLNVCCPLRKIPSVDLDEEEFLHCRVNVIKCSAMGCNKSFTTVAEHASHQRACHTHVCSMCKQSLPAHHLLDLHLLEVHDTLFQLMATRKPMYQCFLETCSEKFSSPAERKTHCISIHKYPKDFRFDMTWRKSEKSKKRGGMSQKEVPVAMDCEATGPADTNAQEQTLPENVATNENNINADVSNRRKLTNKIPNCVSFGVGVTRGFVRGNRGRRGHKRGGGTHWHQKMRPANSVKTNIEEVSMKDLEQALCTE
ncbi:zinc finger protein 511-like [Homarus americanus]|uniref:Zinc finger protein 511-like n=1 Tax=Homarus americanus TaxID=6706 RepID=A0A8J5T439_HOMAM|nr:zinc finger protein 511-like [Homarus americanus]KAG7172739.1 Zinc finger protein 511-like [Homarus americanus]